MSHPAVSRDYGAILLAARNDSKLTVELLAERSGVPAERIRAIEAGREKPDLAMLERFAKTLTMNLRDLLPMSVDTDRGIKALPRAERYRRTIQRGGKDYYLYEDLVTTTEVPTLRPEVLTLLCTDEKDLVMNEGHFLHQCTVALRGTVRFFWTWEGVTHKRDFLEGDSWYIRPFVPHSFISPDPKNLSQIMAFTFAGALGSDAVNELGILGPEAARRIVRETTQWFREPTSSPKKASPGR